MEGEGWGDAADRGKKGGREAGRKAGRLRGREERREGMKEGKEERETILPLWNKSGRVTGSPRMFKCPLRCNHDWKLRPVSSFVFSYQCSDVWE